MTTAAELRALAAEVEGLSGPDRKMDARIATMLGWRWEVVPAILHTTVWRPDGIKCTVKELPRSTHSIDAAASLMPDGWHFSVQWSLAQGRSSLFEVEADRGEFPMIFGMAATEPLARCAAALRARAALLDEAQGAT